LPAALLAYSPHGAWRPAYARREGERARHAALPRRHHIRHAAWLTPPEPCDASVAADDRGLGEAQSRIVESIRDLQGDLTTLVERTGGARRRRTPQRTPLVEPV